VFERGVEAGSYGSRVVFTVCGPTPDKGQRQQAGK
jgi:hypothetical protein